MVFWLTLIILVLSSTAAGNGALNVGGVQTEPRFLPAQTPFSQSRAMQSHLRVRQVATLNHNQEIQYIEFTVDGKFVATESDQSVRWWVTQTGATFHGPPTANIAIENIKRKGCTYESYDPFLRKLPNSEELQFVSRSPDNKMLVTQKVVGRSSVYDWLVLQFWDLATAELRLTSERIRNVCKVYWSRDGESLILVSYRGSKTRFLDAGTGQVKAKLPYDGCVSDSWFGSDGCEPWVISEDSRLAMMEKTPIKLWDIKTGELLAELEGARPPVRFSPTNGRIIATRSRDKKQAILWEVLAGTRAFKAQ